MARALRSAKAGIEAFALSSNQNFPRHAHDQFGIGVLVFGAQRSWSGMGQVESFPGDVIAVNPGEIHDGLAVDGCVRQWRMLYFDPAFLAAETSDEIAYEVELTRPSITDPILNVLFQRLFEAVTVVAHPLAAEESLVRVMMRMLRATSQSRPQSKEPAPAITKAQAMIDDDPASPLTLADLAKVAGTSRYQLLRGFVRHIGATPHAYIIQSRVRLARKLLLEGNSLVEAALELGFTDQSHMTRAFVRQFGITPGRFAAAIS